MRTDPLREKSVASGCSMGAAPAPQCGIIPGWRVMSIGPGDRLPCRADFARRGYLAVQVMTVSGPGRSPGRWTNTRIL